MKLKVAIVCYQYAFEVSPTLKNICSYLFEKGLANVDVFVNYAFDRDKYPPLPSARIIYMPEELAKIGISQEIINQIQKQLYERFIKEHISSYSLIFAVDFLALDILYNAGQDLSNVIFLSMEGIDYILRYDKKYVRDLISECAFCISQSEKRAAILKKHLDSDFDFEYLPVSLRPIENVGRTSCDIVNIIYSGYFAEWACILEFLESYRNSKSFEFSSLILQGHSWGTENYLVQVKKSILLIPNTTIDTTYYSEVAYQEFMQRFDVGLMFYRDLTGTENFSDLLSASGKLVYYLWNGLGILTNIRCKETDVPPFIFIDNFSELQIRQGLLKIKEQRNLFLNAAHTLASDKYNFDLYMKNISKRVFDKMDDLKPISAYQPLMQNKSEQSLLSGNSTLLGIIFSKDRPLQLDATLRSFLLHCNDVWNIQLKILYSVSNQFYQSLYQTLISDYPSVEFKLENDFKDDLLNLISGFNYILFLVDDNIFIKTFCLSEIHDSLNKNPDTLGFSLQLGKNTTYCYPLDKEQRLPAFLELGNGILKYNWTKSELGFNYPLEVSSSVYRVSDILPSLKQLDFYNPNTLESQLAANKQLFSATHPYQLCYEQSVTFCAPINMVQNVWPNRSGKREDYSVENLARTFSDGYRIDVSAYSSLIPKACHQEITLKLKKFKE